MPGDTPVQLGFARGDSTGLEFPAHAEALRKAGPGFLTEAFRRYGILANDNEVVRIVRLDAFEGGNSGSKAQLSVEYAHAAPSLRTELFVKFSRDFEDVFRDRRRYELEAEVRLAALSRLPAFPVKVAACYFADFHRQSGTGVLITERIEFGRDGVEPLHPKCMDHLPAHPVEYYKATVTALAKLAGAHKSGALTPTVENLFPFDRDRSVAEIPIPFNEAQLRERIARFAAFAARCPQLLPPNLVRIEFIQQFEREAVRFLQHEAVIKRFLFSDPDFIALCHWNTHIDNAWFWRDASGTLQCGLLDWGMVRQMNVATALWGGLCGASLEVWDRHLDALLIRFADRLCESGGPALDLSMLTLHLDLTIAMLGLALLMDAPALVLTRLPEAASASGPLDPALHKNEMARSFLHVFTSFLNRWQSQNFDAALNRVLELHALELS